jgi:hypothetical protein
VEAEFKIDPILLENYRKSIDLSVFPRQFRKQFESITDEERTEWFEGRFRCLKYHLYLSGFAEARKTGDPDLPKEFVPILGMDFQPDPHSRLFACFLQKRPGENLVLTDLDTLTKKRMILWPRGLFKTSAVRVDIIQTILNYPDVRICFLTGSDKLAKIQLAAIKKFFERPTGRFKWLFPEFCLKDVRNKKIKEFDDEGVPDPRAWTSELCRMGNAHEFTVPCRTNDILAEPTFVISTTRTTKAGSHYDLIYVDDLVNETNYRKIDALEKSYDSYIDICPILEPFGFMVITGTRYSFGDTYERIQEDAQKEMKEMGQTIWKFFIRDCWSHGCQNCAHTDVYHDFDVNIVQPPCTVPGCQCPGFKDRGNKDVLFTATRTRTGRAIGHTLKLLAQKLIESSPEFFANQYENKPIATGAQTFDETLIGRQTMHSMEQIPPYSSGFTFVVGDLAYIGQAGKDYSVLFICRLFKGQIFVYACEFGNWDSGQVAENIVNVLLVHRPNVIFLEKMNGWEPMERIIAAHASSRGVVKVPIQWEKGSQAANAKLIRIGAVKGPLSARRLWFFAGMKGYDQLVQQLLKWPKSGKHDDFADCAGMVVEAPTGYQLENPPVAVSVANWLRKLSVEQIPEDQYYDNGGGTGLCM